mmetsp:Transcript_2669/g.4757  ORF Transcript_2669/g.4757 Transcript_2669/m.4757 type:complete len:299 (-) Transcript_2669:218-1114(-)
MHARSVPNPDGSSTIYVHHLSHGAPATPTPPPPPQMQMQMQPMMGIPYPMPMMSPPPPPQPMYSPYPSYPPPPPSYGCSHYYQQQQYQQQRQPNVIVIQNEPPKPPKKEEKKEEKKEDKKDPPKEEKKEEKKDEEKKKDDPPPEPKGPQQFSKFSIVSIIVFALALIFGIACVCKTYEAYDGRIAGLPNDHEDYVVDRTVAVGTGGASVLSFTISTLCSFYAGMKHKAKAKREHCCQAGFVIASWIIFCLTFINALIILVLAFDEENIIYPEVVWSALVGSILSWMLMFGYSEMARRG